MVSYAIQDPFEGLIKGQDYVNGLFDQHARLQAGQAYAAGDLTGAAKLLASRGMIPDAQAINTEGTTRSALTAYDAGDPAGALTAAAKGGDAKLYGSLSDAETKEKADRAEWMGNAADALLQIKDPQAREAAFQGQIVPVLKSMGVDQTHIDQIEAGHLTDENLMAFKTSLGQISAMDIQKTDEGDILGIDKKTGATRVLHHATPKPIGGDGGIWSLGADGKYHFQAAPKTITVKNGDGSESIVAVNPAGSPAEGGSAPTPSGPVYDQVETAASQSGATPQEVAYLKRLAQVESSGNPNARNGSSTGIFQFHPATFQANGGGDIHNLGDQTKAALNLSRSDRASLTQGGAEASDANVYLLHQQGPAAGMALLTAPPEVGAVAAITPAYRNPETALAAIAGNIGMPYRTAEQKAAAQAKAKEMTAGQFVDLWHSRWGGGASGGGGGAKVLYTSQGGPDDAVLTPDAVQLMAGKYLANGTLPTFGNGKVAAKNKTEIINAATSMAKTLGLDANDLIAGTASTHALSGALAKASTLRTQLEASEQTLNKNLDYMLSLAPKGAGGAVPVFNRWVQAGRKSIAGDADVTAFNNAVDTAAAESAALMTRATGAGSTPTSDAAMREAHDRFDKAGTLAQLRAAATVARTDGHNRVESYRAMETGIQAQLRAGPGGVVTPAAAAPSTAALASHPVPNAQQIQMLKANQKLWPQFDAKFGPGAASHILNPAKYGPS